MTDSTGNRELTREILQAEGRRRGFDDWQRWVISACPLGEWPGRDMVDLDDVGDPGAWLKSHLEEEFLSDPSGDESFAEYLAESYILSHEELWGESYADYYDSDELYKEFFAGIAKEFVAFIKEWRKRIWAKLET